MSSAAPLQPAPPPETFDIPDGVYVVVDGRGRQWTNVKGAAQLAQKSRRTIFLWIKNRWVTSRRTASGHAEILVSSLWASPEPGTPNVLDGEAANG